MFQVVCTRTLDNADDVEAKVFDYEKKTDAIACFNEKVKAKIDEAVNNEYLQVKMSMHKHKALIQFEGAHYLIAIVKDGGLFSNNHI